MPRKPKGSSARFVHGGVRRGRENASSQCSSTGRYSAEVTHDILPLERPSTKGYPYPKPTQVKGEEGPLLGGPEPSVRYHSGRARILTLYQDLRTKGQPQCKGRRELDCKTHPSSRDESRPWSSNGAEWKSRHSTDKSYSRDNMLIFPKSSHQWEGLAPRCRLFATWGCSTFQGWVVRPSKRYMSWVQNVMRQFDPYLVWALEH
ncbi:hypothetical protein TEA_028826 [Camellia sinensis var. sinensis]|uniref:Uncharacterized protein n=1 Tax=Camellia sinensis var. sinensis TaxID=542762 RepID=A0A4S4E4Y1_CAMSN|nr:hypothetical protein TEA_028826 [Camellia sinensis var. sinensis]